MAATPAAMALRESFGDRRLPEISRKITACVACRKQKIKCHMNGLNPPCTRCKARGLPCTVNKSLQMLLEGDADWKETMEERIKKLEEASTPGSRLQDKLSVSPLDSQTSPSAPAPPSLIASTPESASVYQHSETPGEVTLNLSCNLGSFPGSSIISLTFTEYGAHSGYKPDLITCGVITLEEAEEYYTVYHKSMEPCIYQILADDDGLANIRARSSFLTAAICAVGSIGADLASHQKCYDVYIKEVLSRTFSKHHSYDDVIALCIGAFWLSKVSSTLITMAVRLSAELNLHRCITKMPHKKRECYERTRLYFLVYICDHHCSLVYGKPPMTREFRSLKSPKAFLQSEHCKPEDVKLISQVELWSISSQVFDVFGADVEASVTNERVTELDSLGRSFDLCRSALLGALSISDKPDDFTRQLFDLYIHCAKLSLFSHTFRGSSQRFTARSSTSLFNGMEKFERCALESALAIVKSVAYGSEIQKRLETLPSYFGIMIAFASVSLLKAWGREPIMCYLNKKEISTSLSRLVDVYFARSARLQTGHPLRSVAKSLKAAMNQYCQISTNTAETGYLPDSMDTAMFPTDNTRHNSLSLDYLGDYSNLLGGGHHNEFPSDFFGLQNM